MKAIKINSKRMFNLVSNAKSFIRLGGFETGLRTNLSEAMRMVKMFIQDPSMKHIEHIQYSVDYCNEVKLHMTNCNGVAFELRFDDEKIKHYTVEIDGMRFIFDAYMGFCNVYYINSKPLKSKAKNIEVVLRRASSSRTLATIKNHNFPVRVETLTISENAPCSIRRDGTYPAQFGWNELASRDLAELDNGDIYPSHYTYNVWIKTATLGGRKRIWVQKLS